MEYWLDESPWRGVILWVVLYISDYYLTLASARGFREIGHFQFEGSFELTPQYQKDIDAFKPVSRLHITLLILYSLIIFLLWWLTHRFYYLEDIYLLYLGIFLLLETAIHARHFRNLHLIREIKKNGGADGQIAYKKTLTYKISAFDLYIFSILFFLVFILTFSYFFLGGALICLVTGLKHARLAGKAAKETAKTNFT